jgi:hypothetical protein
MASFTIGQTVWFEGKQWEICDSFRDGTYALGVRNSEGTWGKGSKAYGFIEKENGRFVEDPKCPFSTKYTYGFVPARYLSHVLDK